MPVTKGLQGANALGCAVSSQQINLVTGRPAGLSPAPVALYVLLNECVQQL